MDQCSECCAVIRCPSCPPPAAGVGGLHLIRLRVVIYSCPCPDCGEWALVLDSGAQKPYCHCLWCNRCQPAPARRAWRKGRPNDQIRVVDVQLSLF